MAGVPYSPEEEEWLAQRIARRESNTQIYAAHQTSGFPPRAAASIAAARSKRPAILARVQELRAATERAATGGEDMPAFGVVFEEGEHEAVAESTGTRVRTLDALLEQANVDPGVWAVQDHTVKSWEVGIKVGAGEDARVVTETLWGVRASLKRRLETYLPQPVVLRVTRPRLPKSAPGLFTSLHYSDIHFPHHDPRALNILYQIAEFVRPGFVCDHGDTLDCQEISKYPKDPLHRVSLKDEILMGAMHHGIMHELTPDADHVWLEGNHEQRLTRLIWGLAEQRAAGEILTLPAVQASLTWGSLMGLDSLGWETVPYPGHYMLHDKLILKHGSQVRPHSGATARAEHEKYGKSGMSGHTHRRGVFESRDHNGVHMWVELGMLGRVRDDYVDFPDWHQGLVCATWSDDRQVYGVEHIRIHDGETYFRGRHFRGDARDFGDIAA
jgi:hypothetical protein